MFNAFFWQLFWKINRNDGYSELPNLLSLLAHVITALNQVVPVSFILDGCDVLSQQTHTCKGKSSQVLQ